MSTIFGVDFGTSNSCISIIRDDKDFRVIQNEYGKYTTPTCVYFDATSEDIVYGDLALQQSNYRGTLISNIKRLFGITFIEFSNDTNLKSFFKTLHIEKCTESDYCCIVLQHNNRIHRFTPHNIAQMYLNWLLTTTKSIVKDASNDIVITVPVKFTNNQRIIAVHNTFISKEDLTFTKSYIENRTSNIAFCLCPNANLYIENNLPPIDLLVKNNCTIVLGTDSLASNHQLNMLEEIKTIQQYYPKIELQTLLQWATSNGAAALQMKEKLGSFEKGKKPGLVLIEENLKESKRIL